MKWRIRQAWHWGIVALAVCSVVAKAQEKPASEPRPNPFGTQVSSLPANYTRPSSKLLPPANKGPVEPVAALLGRAAAAHNAALLPQRLEWTGDGTITFRTSGGGETQYPVTVLHKGTNKVQRTIKYPSGEIREGTDGTFSWGGGLLGGPASGSVMRFIESHTVRSVSRLFAEGATAVRDTGMKAEARGLEVQDSLGRKTTYVLDPITALVVRSEVVIGETRHMISGTPVPDVETYAYSDYRAIDGVLTPFRIEIYHSGFKVQDIQFDTVRYNTGVKDDAFRP